MGRSSSMTGASSLSTREVRHEPRSGLSHTYRARLLRRGQLETIRRLLASEAGDSDRTSAYGRSLGCALVAATEAAEALDQKVTEAAERMVGEP